MAKAINVRLDVESERALRVIRSSTGMTSSEAVRAALVEAAKRHVSDEAIREAWKRSWEDPEYVREVEELLAFQDDPWDRIAE